MNGKMHLWCVILLDMVKTIFNAIFFVLLNVEY